MKRFDKATPAKSPGPPPGDDVWADIIWELGKLALYDRLASERIRKVQEKIRNLDEDAKEALLSYLWREGHGGEATLEGFEGVLGMNQPVKPPKRMKKAKKEKTPLKGPKTPFMHDQLKAFKKFLDDSSGYKGDRSTLYAWAAKCWRTNQRKWDKAKCDGGTEHGYSCSKALADAYKKLTDRHLAALL